MPLIQNQFVFDPQRLHGLVEETVAKAGMDGLDSDQQLVDLLARLRQTWPDAVARDLEWVSVSAGYGTQATAILHVTPYEYLVVTGSPLPTGGVSGRMTCTLHDFVIDGELLVAQGDRTETRRLKPGDVYHLQAGETISFEIQGHAWMLEYARGFVPAMFLFPIWATLFSTLDFRSLWKLVKLATRRMCIDWLGWTPTLRWRNWMGNQRILPHQIRHPYSLAALQGIVREGLGHQQRVRAFGSSHAWSALVPTDDILVNMGSLDRLVAVDAANKQITVEAGMRLDRAIQHAWAHGWWIPSTSAIKSVTVGGLAATGSHGTGRQTATFSDNIVAMTLVDGNGDVRTVDGSDPEELAAARVSLGALGLVHTITLQCLEGGVMDSVVRHETLSATLKNLDAWVAKEQALSVYWFPFTDTCSVYTWNETDAPITYGWVNRLIDQAYQVVGEWVFGAALVFLIDHGFRFLTPLQTRLVAWSMGPKQHVKSPVDAGHYFFTYHPVQDSGWALPTEHAADAFQVYIDTIAEYKDRGLMPINMIVHMRFVRGSEAYLSPALRRESCYIEAATSVKAEASDQFYRDIEETLQERFDARPHWAKLWTLDAHIADLHGSRGPAVRAFKKVRRDFDPNGVFLNALVRKVLRIPKSLLGGERAAEADPPAPDGPTT